MTHEFRIIRFRGEVIIKNSCDCFLFACILSPYFLIFYPLIVLCIVCMIVLSNDEERENFIDLQLLNINSSVKQEDRLINGQPQYRCL
jgi:hypothetical protein